MAWYTPATSFMSDFGIGAKDFLGDIGFTGSGAGKDAVSGWGGDFMTGVGGYMDYKQAGKDRKDKLKMFDKSFGAEQDQIAFQNKEYTDKRDAEEKAWGNFKNPYATTGNTIV